MKFLVIAAVVLTGVFVAFQRSALAEQGDVGDYETTEAAQSQAAPAVSPPNPYPCHFGPITKRITQNDVGAIIVSSPSLRAAWYAILARPDDEEAEPLGFQINAPDDGLADGLVCPAASP